MRRVTSTIPSSRYSGPGRRPRSPSNGRERKRPQNTSRTLAPEAIHSVLLPRRDSHDLRNTPQKGLAFSGCRELCKGRPHTCKLVVNSTGTTGAQRSASASQPGQFSRTVGALTSMGWKCGRRRPSIRDLAWASQKEAKPGRGHAGGTVHTRPLVGVQAVVPEVSLGKTCLRFASAGQFFACGLSTRTGCRERTQRWRQLPNC